MPVPTAGARAPRGALSLTVLVPGAQLCCCPSLQPEAGLRKGPAAEKRSRSQSAPPAPGQGLPGRPAAVVALPRWRCPVGTMEEMLIWEQYTVTLTKVSMARVAAGGVSSAALAPPDPSLPVSARTLNGALALPSLEARTVPTGQLGTQQWSFRMWWLGDQQWAGCSECAGTWGHKGCSLPAGMGSDQGCCQAGVGCPRAMGALTTLLAPPAGSCAWGRATAAFSLTGGRITS